MDPNPIPPPGQTIVRVLGDSETDLEALFNAVMNPKPGTVPHQVPMRMRKLPESFFKQPDSGSHSRQSSTDSSNNLPQLQVQHIRSHSSPASLPVSANPNPQQYGHLRQQSFDNIDDIPLPPGWEMAKTPSGQRYFLNHVDRITTWHDPRKTMSQMNLNTAGTSNQLQQRSMGLPHPNPVMSQQQMTPNTTVTPSGMPSQNPRMAMMSLSSAMTVQQKHQQKMRLQQIQMEKERIKHLQQELMRQEKALYNQIPSQIPIESENIPTAQNAVSTPTMTQEMHVITNNGSDPFLSSGPYHSRQASADSGLGLGRTPEDFLGHVEEMDTGEMGQTAMTTTQPSRFPDFLDSLPASNVDLGTLEGEDLMPSLQEPFGSDILPDVESSLNPKETFLTWL
ncbi:WW domain-containing transcription regulator protein 1 isoform X2 [Hypanus sabinus]|uniref:WW domain-containing transcription regulator protein 1 isoform X2 n=1 Tax=Hypanus sabinus TaxID=79690 RepID=UPI0028C39CF2|nr:WW domain-containing transcription regulator protein 1 isoform X2 [Hypanus sabinus]